MFQPSKNNSHTMNRDSCSPITEFAAAIVFGGANGIGAGIGELLLNKRIPMLVSVDRDRSFSEETILDAKRGAYSLNSDVTDIERLRLVTRKALTRSFDLAVFAAGICDDERPALTNEVNVQGTKNCFEVASPLLREGATTVFISSDLITWPNGMHPSPYVESKRAVAEFAALVARQRPDLRVLILLPGPVGTQLFFNGKSQDKVQEIEDRYGILTPKEFSEMLFNEGIPRFVGHQSGAAARMYKKTGFEWITL